MKQRRWTILSMRRVTNPWHKSERLRYLHSTVRTARRTNKYGPRFTTKRDPILQINYMENHRTCRWLLDAVLLLFLIFGTQQLVLQLLDMSLHRFDPLTQLLPLRSWRIADPRHRRGCL